MSEVPLGAFLSGLDSSAWSRSWPRSPGRGSKTFSIGYEGAGSFQDERRYAPDRGGAVRHDHREFVVSPDVEALLPDLVATMSKPFADSSVIPNYYISKLTRQHVTVALSGLGATRSAAATAVPRHAVGERYRRFPRASPFRLVGGGSRAVARRAIRPAVDRPDEALLRDGDARPADRYAAMATTFFPADRRDC